MGRLIVPTFFDRSHAAAWERRPGRSSAIRMASTPRRVAFFSLPAQRKEPKERAALPLRRPRSTGCGTGGARTRCAQTACPFFPVPHPADRLSAKGLFASPETRPAPHRPPGGASLPPRGGGFCGGSFPRSAWERHPGRSSVRLSCRPPTTAPTPPSRAWPPSGKSGTCGGACRARETNATLDKTILPTMELGNDPGTPNPVQKHHRSSG